MLLSPPGGLNQTLTWYTVHILTLNNESLILTFHLNIQQLHHKYTS